MSFLDFFVFCQVNEDWFKLEELESFHNEIHSAWK